MGRTNMLTPHSDTKIKSFNRFARFAKSRQTSLQLRRSQRQLNKRHSNAGAAAKATAIARTRGVVEVSTADSDKVRQQPAAPKFYRENPRVVPVVPRRCVRYFGEHHDDFIRYTRHIALLQDQTKTNEVNLRPSNLANQHFGKNLSRQFSRVNANTAELLLLKQLEQSLLQIRQGHANMSATTAKPPSNVHISVKPFDEEQNVVLLPRTQWVYTTPKKQRMRRMEELNFESEEPCFRPAIFEQGSGTKTIYRMAENIVDKVNLTCVVAGQQVPVDTKYMSPLCTISTGNMFPPFEPNQFLNNATEKSINLNSPECSRRSLKRPLGDNNDLNWYEKKMKLLATARPAKQRVSRMTELKRRTLSFDSGTPNSHLRLHSRFLSMNNTSTANDDSEPLIDDDLLSLDTELYEMEIENIPMCSTRLTSLFDTNAITEDLPSFMKS